LAFRFIFSTSKKLLSILRL